MTYTDGKRSAWGQLFTLWGHHDGRFLIHRLPPARSKIPRIAAFDSTFSLALEGYEFIGKRCDRCQTDIFRTRTALEPTKPHPDSELEFGIRANLTACGTSPSQGYGVYVSLISLACKG